MLGHRLWFVLAADTTAGCGCRLLTVDVEDLGWVDEDQGEESATTYEDEDQDDNHGSLGFGKHSSWNHGMVGAELPYDEGGYENESKNKRHEVVNAAPVILEKR